MAAATEYAPAVCIPVPAGAPGRSVPSGSAVGLASVSVLHVPRDRSSASAVRLTRRGVVVLGLLVALVAGALLWLAAGSAPEASGASGVPQAPASVTVRDGDTLWDIAARVAPQRDPRDEVAQLRRINGLHDVELVPGQRLRVR